VEQTGKRAVRKKRSKNVMMKVIVIWTFLMFLAVWIRHHNTQGERKKEFKEQLATKMTTGTLADERVALLNKALPECHRALGGFLSAGTPEGRNQFVVNPIETAGKMATFYSFNPFPKVDIKLLNRTAQEIIQVGDTWMITTRWKETNGVEFDAVFRRDAGTWRLDWEHFAQYSEYPWTLFLSGDGPDEAEFRLLARQRNEESDSERDGSRLTVAMHAPVFGKPEEEGMISPDLVIDRRGDEGLIITAALKARKNGENLFGQTLEPLERRDLVRLRVTVKRSDFGGNRSFKIEKISACHWIDSDTMGVDLEKLKDDLFGN
jgi:hypothetical protein